MRLDEMIRDGSRCIGDPAVAMRLAERLIGRPREWILAHSGYRVKGERGRLYGDWAERAASGEPEAYITGTVRFCGTPVRVDRRVLIPRPETELLVRRAAVIVPRGGRVLEIGTGSGCISAALSRVRPDADILATDISIGALSLARINAPGVRLVAGDLVDFLKESALFDALLSNPPYVANTDVDLLDPIVRENEPPTALFGGEDGLEVIRRIADSTASLCSAGAPALIEIGYGQADAVRGIFSSNGWEVTRVHPDDAGIPRILESRWSS